MDQHLKTYLEEKILPSYDFFDAAHRRDHAETVIRRSLELAVHYPVNEDMVIVGAAFHDLGLCEGRKFHHLVSGRILREDPMLCRWFSREEIEVMAQAAEDHRASSDHEPRSLYGRILAEADRLIEPLTVIRRTMQYTQSHWPGLEKEGQWERLLEHLQEKYAEGGYLKLWIPESPNTAKLEELRALIRDKAALRRVFEQLLEDLEQETDGKK